MHLIYIKVTCEISRFSYLSLTVYIWKNWIYCIDLFLHYFCYTYYLDSHYHYKCYYPRNHLFVAETTEIWANSFVLWRYMLCSLTVRNPIFSTFFGNFLLFIMWNHILIIRNIVYLIFIFLIVFFFKEESMLIQTNSQIYYSIWNFMSIDKFIIFHFLPYYK